MKSKYFLGLMTVVMSMSACGKSLHLTPQGIQDVNAVQKAQAEKLAKKRIAELEKEGKVILNLNQPNVLSALSDKDLDEVKALLPYKNEMTLTDPVTGKRSVDLGHVSQDIGNPSFVVSGKRNKSHRFVKASNLVFRSVVKIPSDLTAIKAVKGIHLKLKGLRMAADKDATKSGLSGQMLCVIDTKLCSGELQTDAANLNGTYGNPINAKFAKAALLLPEHVIDNGDQTEMKVLRVPTVEEGKGISSAATAIAEAITGVISVAPATVLVDSKTAPAIGTNVKVAALAKEPELETISLDLKDLFDLSSDKDAIAWIEKNSTVFSDQYRKFRFVIGNNVYAESGELSIEIDEKDLDQSKLVKNYKSIQMQTSNDTSRVQATLNSDAPEVIDVNRTLLDADLSLSAKDAKRLDETSLAKLSTVTNAILASKAVIQEIVVLVNFDGTLLIEADRTAAAKVAADKGQVILDQLKANGIAVTLKRFPKPSQTAEKGTELRIRLSPELSSAERKAQSEVIQKILDQAFSAPKVSN